MYNKVLRLIKHLGDDLPKHAGNIADIGVKKQWLTEKDIEIEQKIADLVKRFDKNHSIFAEELHDDFQEAENIWIIDPISNTNGFINGWHHYAITVCHMHKGELKFAAIYDPTVKEMFTAYKDKGAFLNGKKIKVSDRKEKFYFLFPAVKRPPFNAKQNTSLFKKLIELGSIRNIGSLGLHYCYVACGRADCAISLNKDTFPEFAGKLILEEAGGKMTDFNGNELNKNSRGIIASRKDLYYKFLNITNISS